MPRTKPTYSQLSEKVKWLEEEIKQARQTNIELGKFEQRYGEAMRELDKMCREIYALRSMVKMPQLYLDQNWNIVGYSSDFPLLTRKIKTYTRLKKNVSEFFNELDFDKIDSYMQSIKALEDLPYDKGDPWELRYKGPDQSDKIGGSWIVFAVTENCRWEIVEKKGKLRIVHKPHVRDHLDCCLMTAREYSGADEDIKLVYKVTTSRNKTHIRDLTAILSGASGREATTPDMFGYSAGVASNYNSEGRIQKHGANVITHPEVLEAGTEYQITFERTGGRITRIVANLQTGKELPPLEFIDYEAVYDRENHIGFYTYSGEAEIYDVEVYTRKSRFNIEQFKIPINVTVGIREDKLKGRIFKLKYAKNEIMGSTLHTLMLEDITKRRKDVKALRISEEKYRALFEESRDPIATTSRAGMLVDVNPAMENLFGYTRQEMINMDIRRLYAHPRERKEFQRVIESNGYVRDYELEMKKKDGTLIDCLVNSTVRRTGGGNIFGYQGSYHDITERKRIEDQLKDSQKLEIIGKLASGVAHEVRNPLNAILAITEALFQDIGDDPEYRPYLDHIHTQVDRLSTLMKDLLDLGKPLQVESFTPVSLLETCSGAIELWKQSSIHQNRDVFLVQPAGAETIQVLGDGSKLKQVFINLLENAAQHSPVESEILITMVEPARNMLSVRIKDFGTGLPPENISEVFKPFFTTRKRGAGLGLSIVKTIIETHGGRIKLWNNDPPPGLTVEVVLPLTRQEGINEKKSASGR